MRRLIFAALLVAPAAVAQQQDETKPQERSAEPGAPVEVEDSAILPNAEGHEESRASTMRLDCDKDPNDCLEPLDPDEVEADPALEDAPARPAPPPRTP